MDDEPVIYCLKCGSQLQYCKPCEDAAEPDDPETSDFVSWDVFYHCMEKRCIEHSMYLLDCVLLGQPDRVVTDHSVVFRIRG